jgi:hypothetical protein
MKKALVIYIGNGYSEKEYSYDNSYSYSVDMRENFENHKEMIFEPLMDMGYESEIMLVTNKHKKYDEFVDFYGAIPVEYEDLTHDDFEILKNYYFSKSEIPPGNFRSGGRLLKITSEIPKADIYVVIRADVQFLVSLSSLSVDFEKMNWLWPETDWEIFTEFKDHYLKNMGTEFSPWNLHRRVNGNAFNIIPHRFFNVFKNYISMEHTSFRYMYKELNPLVQLSDIHLMLGEENCYVSDMRFCQNPVYKLNKKIIDNISELNVKSFGPIK